MTTAAPSTALATIQPAFTDAERLALAGFLAGYRGLTREAYALDLRQFTSWCRARSLHLFAVRRAACSRAPPLAAGRRHTYATVLPATTDGIGEGGLDRGERGGWGGSGHRAPPGRAETRQAGPVAGPERFSGTQT